MATDGLFDVCDDQEAIDLICKDIQLEKRAERLVKYAIDNDSSDNTLVIVIDLNEFNAAGKRCSIKNSSTVQASDSKLL